MRDWVLGLWDGELGDCGLELGYWELGLGPGDWSWVTGDWVLGVWADV